MLNMAIGAPFFINELGGALLSSSSGLLDIVSAHDEASEMNCIRSATHNFTVNEPTGQPKFRSAKFAAPTNILFEIS